MRQVHDATWVSRVGRVTRVRWRNLTWKEYREIQSRCSSLAEMYFEAYRTCLLTGPTPETVIAGISFFVGQHQIDNNPFSGEFSAINKALKVGREEGSGYLNRSKAVVAWAFRYPFEEIDHWEASVFFERLAQAEYILGKPLDPVNPDAPQDPQEKTARPMNSNQKDQLRRKQAVERRRGAGVSKTPTEQESSDFHFSK